MNCTKCKAEWTPPKGISITQCPFCGKPLFEIQNSKIKSEPHEILQEIVQRYDKQKLSDTLLKGLLSDLMPHVERKYQRIFKQALDDRIGAKLLELEDENDSIRIVKINTIKNSFKNNNGFDKTADYVVDCFLFALGWIETINKEQYSSSETDKLSAITLQIEMAFADNVFSNDEAEILNATAKKLGILENEVAELLDKKIKSLKLKKPPKQIHRLEQNFETVIIGTQEWMKKNLDVEQFQNGDIIPNVKSSAEWIKYGKEMLPCWCFYENNDEVGNNFGKLYNWWAVNDPRGLAPKGWHLPNSVEWKTLEKFCGKNAGKKLQSKLFWFSKSGSDDFGLSILPCGKRNRYGIFEEIEKRGYYWTIEEFNKSKSKAIIFWEYGGITNPSYENNANGFSIRCIKNADNRV